MVSTQIQLGLKVNGFTKHDKYLHSVHRRYSILYRGLNLLLLLPPFFLVTPSARTLSRMKYVLTQVRGSSDPRSQQKCIGSIIANMGKMYSYEPNLGPPSAELSNILHDATDNTSPKSNMLPQDLFYFIVDTDSVSYVIDTGSDRIIVNDTKLLHDLRITADKVKGIEGKCVRISGVGKLSLPL